MTVIPLRRDQPEPGHDVPPGGWHERIWVTDDPIVTGDTYRRCVADFRQSGLWPVLIPYDDRFAFSGEDWIDDRAFMSPAPERAQTADPEKVLAGWWEGSCCDGKCLEPYGDQFPGLIRKSTANADPLAIAADHGAMLVSVRPHDRGYRLGLVAVDRPSDVPAALGWTGMINYTQDVGGVSAVLRSWEDRLGATLVVLGFDSLILSVAAPPTSLSRAVGLAAEHRAFCLDNFRQQRGDLREFAKPLVHSSQWRFWWD